MFRCLPDRGFLLGGAELIDDLHLGGLYPKIDRKFCGGYPSTMNPIQEMKHIEGVNVIQRRIMYIM